MALFSPMKRFSENDKNHLCFQLINYDFAYHIPQRGVNLFLYTGRQNASPSASPGRRPGSGEGKIIQEMERNFKNGGGFPASPGIAGRGPPRQSERIPLPCFPGGGSEKGFGIHPPGLQFGQRGDKIPGK
jgi:hypothetical protein